jgi:hypothetical protein
MSTDEAAYNGYPSGVKSTYKEKANLVNITPAGSNPLRFESPTSIMTPEGSNPLKKKRPIL